MFVESFVEVVGRLARAVDGAKVPTCFEAGGDGAESPVAAVEELDGGGDEEGVEEEGGDGRLSLADVEEAGAGEDGA